MRKNIFERLVFFYGKHYTVYSRNMHWFIENHDEKQLITSLGTVHFTKTLFTYKDGKDEDGKEIMCYLLDKTLGFTENMRITDDAVA